MLWLAVAIGGSFGAMARYGVSLALAPQSSKFPFGTLTANVLGSFLMGVCYIVIVEKGLLPATMRQPLMVGFLGAFTTFSSFSIETLNLIQAGNWPLAGVYMGASLGLCLLAVYIAITLTEKIL
ncbi:fluoride efflux transporter CrcB [Teredinibacter waterburyi]|jgi:camphor resistance protein CrcB|uniref:fluoride efflux transporter CrcB n=1 Tax=Teredinibacter waterburyi TaxID=1500538 RepID=UPI00165FE91C|nr:fluoride efflux transporter CrcB [Teredinibacter waterburyi]